jgi:hypothetical protein
LVTITAYSRQRLRDLACGGIDIGEVGKAVAAPRRRADRDEHRIGPRGAAEIGREGQPPRPCIGPDEIGETRLEDRHLAALEPLRSCLPALSTQTTSWPKSAKQAPETRPT